MRDTSHLKRVSPSLEDLQDGDSSDDDSGDGDSSDSDDDYDDYLTPAPSSPIKIQP